MIIKYTDETEIHEGQWVCFTGGIRIATCYGRVTKVNPKSVTVMQAKDWMSGNNLHYEERQVRNTQIELVCTFECDAVLAVNKAFECFEEANRIQAEADAKKNAIWAKRLEDLLGGES